MPHERNPCSWPRPTSPTRPSVPPTWTASAAATPNCAAGSRRCCGPTTPRRYVPDGARGADTGQARITATRRARVGAILAGKYKLIEEIGEGGMGSVYMAQQTEPVKRAVAVKVIKAGMDSKAVLARFEAERQALALMDHPNIAKVLDAGTTEGGRPFFVMELVKGVPITQFCDERKLTPAAAAGTVRAGLPGDPARPPEGRSSTATSSRPTCWWRCTTTGRCRR